jgi:hypothetical protein
MKKELYVVYFKGGEISATAWSETEATILAQAEAIKRGWDYTVVKILNKSKINRLLKESANDVQCYYIPEQKNTDLLFWLG